MTFTDMLDRFVGALALAALACLALPATAHAQIYSWRDDGGNLVLSDRPLRDGRTVQLYAVPKANAIRTTRSTSTGRSSQYDDLLLEHARLNDVRPDLVRAVVQVESAYNPRARSPKGALGLMQLMPATIREFGVVDPFNPDDNVRAGVRYLRQLLDRYQNNEQLALAAYNAGPGAVDKYGQQVPPYRETRQYVAQIDQMTRRPVERRDNRIYKVIEVIDGRLTIRYTDKKPTSGDFEVVGR